MTGLALFRPRRLGRLMAADALNIARDPVLLFALVMGLVPAPLLAANRDSLDAGMLQLTGVTAFSRYLVPLALLLPAYLAGWVTGFLLLEDRDEGTLVALDVTPVGKTGFLGYRAGVTAAFAALLAIWGEALLLPGTGPVVLGLLVVLIAGEAVLSAAVLPAIARNKVEGLALTKIVNLGALVPLLAAVPSPLRYVAGVLPPFWIGELLGLADTAYLPVWAIVVLAIAVHGIAAVWLFRLFGRRVG